MKKLILTMLAATMATTPVLAAPAGNHRYDGRQSVVQRTVVKQKVVVRDDHRHPQAQYRSWQRGQRFDARYARDYRLVANPRAYRLHDAPRGYRWVRSGNDAVLIGIASGIVANVVANAIR